MIPANATVRALLDARCQQTPDAVFLIDPTNGVELSFANIRQRALQVAGFAASQNIPKGASIAFAMRNGADAASVILGLYYGGYGPPRSISLLVPTPFNSHSRTPNRNLSSPSHRPAP